VGGVVVVSLLQRENGGGGLGRDADTIRFLDLTSWTHPLMPNRERPRITSRAARSEAAGSDAAPRLPLRVARGGLGTRAAPRSRLGGCVTRG